MLIGSVPDQSLKELEVRHLFKAQLIAVLEVLLVLLRTFFAQLSRGIRLFNAAKIFKARWFPSCIDGLPGKLSESEVDHDVTESKQIVPTRQFVAQVCVYWHKPSCSDQVFSGPELDMLSCFFVEDGAGESEVDHMNDGRLFADAGHDVVGFDVSVYDSLFVHMLNPRD